MRIKRRLFWMIALLSLAFGSLSVAAAQDTSIQPAKIVNDEGGPVSVTGKVTYTNGFFTAGVDEPLVILEDEAGFALHLVKPVDVEKLLQALDALTGA